jgi:hypothetical protein
MENQATDTNQPTVVEALRAVLAEDFDDELRADRIVIQPRGTGEVAYRLHPRGAEDYVGGVATIT